MKTSTLIAVCAVAAIAAMFSEAQMVLPGPPPIMPAFGALPFMGGLGFGLGGLGLMGGLGFGRLGLGLGLLGRKKRDIAGADAVNITISTQTSAICAEVALGQRIMCDVEPRLTGVPDIKLHLIDLFVAENKNERVLNLLSPKWTATTAPFTFLEPVSRKPSLLSVFTDSTITKPGFLVKDKVCYDAIWDAIKDDLLSVRVKLVAV